MGMGMAINTAQLRGCLFCEGSWHELLVGNVGEYNHQPVTRLEDSDSNSAHDMIMTFSE